MDTIDSEYCIDDWDDATKLINNIFLGDPYKTLFFLADKEVIDEKIVVANAIDNENYELLDVYYNSPRRDILYEAITEDMGNYEDDKFFKWALSVNYDRLDEYIEIYDDGFEFFLNEYYDNDDNIVTRLLQRYPDLNKYLNEDNRKDYDAQQIGAIAPNFTGKLPLNVVDNILRQAGYDSLSLYESMQVLQPILEPEGQVGAGEFKQYKSPE